MGRMHRWSGLATSERRGAHPTARQPGSGAGLCGRSTAGNAPGVRRLQTQEAGHRSNGLGVGGAISVIGNVASIDLSRRSHLWLGCLDHWQKQQAKVIE